MHVTRSRIIVAAAAVLAVLAIGYALRPTALAVDTAIVDRRPLEATVDADGRTRVRQRYVVVAPVAGRVERITRVEGAAVRAGDVVARLAPLPLDAEAVMQARARVDATTALALEAAGQVRTARAALEQRRRELSRAVRLAEVGGIAPRAVEECQLAVVEAEEAVRGGEQRARAAEADSRVARATLASREGGGAGIILVRAPAAGRVLHVPERSERIVAAGTPLLEVGDPASLEVVIDVLSSDATGVHPGDRVRFSEWGSGDRERMPPVGGSVREIEPAGFTKLSALGVEEQRVNVIVDVDALPPAIGDGFRVEASIIVWTAPAVIAVPRSALLQQTAGREAGGGWSVYVEREGRAESRTVRIGHLGGVDAEVLAGLNPGDRVVLFPSDRVTAGARVKSRQR